jgi:cysteine synthase
VHGAGVLHLIGRTPLVELRHCSPKPGVRLFAKLEGFNPTGSLKDRIVLAMIERARRDGALRPGDTIVEASTGNTGISLAMIGRALGYRVKIVAPENIFPEIPRMLAVYGAEVVWVPAELGVPEAIRIAGEIARREGALMLDQFSNHANCRAHYDTTGPEILDDLPEVDVLVAGVGTGGTMMGAGSYLKERRKGIRLVAVEPHPGSHLQGLTTLTEGFIPPLLDLGLLDAKILVRSSSAFIAAAEVMRREGIFAGVSSGAVLHAGMKYARRLDRGNVVLIFADAGWKYLGTNLWMEPPHPEEESLDDTIWW